MVDWVNAGSIATNIAIMVISITVIGGVIIAGIWLGLKWKRYQQYKCVIYEKDGFGQLTETYDSGGIFIDSKTKNKRLYLKQNKVGLDPDSIPFIQTTKGKRVIYLLKTGLKNFHYIRLNIKPPAVTLTVGEEDVNWALNSYERGKKMFTQGMLMQLLPYIALAFVSIIILIIFIYFFKDFAVLADVAKALQAAAEAFAQSQTGTTVIQG